MDTIDCRDEYFINVSMDEDVIISFLRGGSIKIVGARQLAHEILDELAIHDAHTRYLQQETLQWEAGGKQ